MKKIMILCALLCATLMTFSQMQSDVVSNSDIARIIGANQETNQRYAGVTNPNLIYVGQQLRYVFPDGKDTLITVTEKHTKKGQWGIVETILALEKIHGQVIAPTPDSSGNNEAGILPVTENNSDDGIPWWLWAIVAFVVLAILGSILESNKRKKEVADATKDPVTSGTPMRRGGVTDQQAPAYMQEVASRQFNMPGLNVTNITRGRLSGENLEVYYGGQIRPERRTFENFLAYRGEVTVNGQQEFVYFLQGCGNDVRMGNYFSGQNISFVPEQVLQTQTATVQTQTTQPVAEPVGESHFLKLAKIADVAMKNGDEVIFNAENGEVKIQLKEKKFSLNGKDSHQLAVTTPGVEQPVVN